ncbi:alpha/beta-hydrolase [Cylindrobasidium torrendii FP15055 ss-10]|uniref:Alpha/beta-hydrolase n=1 Tax=Cylindrobasidium torrendii FP15055 ss-10 TaxID=1314674 RepID=A0A0D7ATB0_9AGAR|nr:alpha/beta-hydrolase [Cylindrobasidium torrendii FP15055 ss-10]
MNLRDTEQTLNGVGRPHDHAADPEEDMCAPLSSFLLATSALVAAQSESAEPPKFDWGSIQPSVGTLEWEPCYSTFECGRLSVPFNYSSPDDGTAAIAVIRLPSNVSSTDEGYRGPVLLNPGGPSGSGVEFLLALKPRMIESLFGSSYDLVSFDPRGMGRTTPPIRFYTSDSQRDEWTASQALLFNTTVNPAVLDDSWPYYSATGDLAKQNDKEGILPYVSTDNVARDMLSIVEAMGGKKLQYYGISYGTVLGSVFASLFPDKIERMVLDGVVNVENYFKGIWTPLLETADEALADFAKDCFDAGSEVCAFHGNASSADQIHQSVFDLLDTVIKDPVAIPGPDSNGRSVDFAALKIAIFDSMYHPYSTYPLLAQGLAELQNGNGTIISLLSGSVNGSIEISNLDPDFVYDSRMQSEGLVAVACSDAGTAVASLDDLKAKYDEDKKFSSFSDILLTTETACGLSVWKVRPEATFRDPGPIAADNTSFPILFIGNTLDPVTPLSARAKTVSANFPGSVVLTQNSGGHSSVTSPSSCSRKYVMDYFLKGSLPEPGTTCEVDFEVFNFPGNDTEGLYL